MMNLDEAKAIIRKYEGCKLVAYLCPAGKWTIGYGSTYYQSGQKVKEGDTLFDPYVAEVLLDDVLKPISRRVKDMCYPVVLNENQHNALVSFAYNVGLDDDEDKIPEGFGDSTLLKLIHKYWHKLGSKDYFTSADIEHIAMQFDKWIYSKGKKLPGLVTRREEEKNLFLRPIDANNADV
jgi:lysozyme